MLQGLIPSVETLPEGLTMNTVLREAIDHIKAQHAQAKGEQADGVARTASGGHGDHAAAAAVKEEGAGARGLAMALHRQDEGAIPDMITVIQTKMGQDGGPGAGGGGAAVAATAGGTDAAATGADAAAVAVQGPVDADSAAAEGAMPLGERHDSGLSDSGVKESRCCADLLALGRMPDYVYDTHICMCVCVFVCVCVRVCVCVCVCTHTHTHTHTCIYMMYICVYEFIYMHMYLLIL